MPIFLNISAKAWKMAWSKIQYSWVVFHYGILFIVSTFTETIPWILGWKGPWKVLESVFAHLVKATIPHDGILSNVFLNASKKGIFCYSFYILPKILMLYMTLHFFLVDVRNCDQLRIILWQRLEIIFQSPFSILIL